MKFEISFLYFRISNWFEMVIHRQAKSEEGVGGGEGQSRHTCASRIHREKSNTLSHAQRSGIKVGWDQREIIVSPQLQDEQVSLYHSLSYSLGHAGIFQFNNFFKTGIYMK